MILNLYGYELAQPGILLDIIRTFRFINFYTKIFYWKMYRKIVKYVKEMFPFLYSIIFIHTFPTYQRPCMYSMYRITLLRRSVFQPCNFICNIIILIMENYRNKIIRTVNIIWTKVTAFINKTA